MKSASWAGSVILIIALGLVYLARAAGEPDLPELRLTPAPPGAVLVQMSATGRGWSILDDFSSEVSLILQRELGLSENMINHGYSSMSSGPMGSSAAMDVSCSAPDIDLAVLEPALMGAAIDGFEWLDDSRRVSVRLSHTTLGGQVVQRDLVRLDGRVQWVDTADRP